MVLDDPRPTPLERAAAIAIPRAILGLVYLFAGIHKLTDLGPIAFGGLMAQSEAARFLPGAMLVAAGTLTPYLELALGALLICGLWTRAVLRVLTLLVILIAMAWGVHGLLHPVGATAMNVSVVNFYILPRAALLILLLFLAREDDRLSVDALVGVRGGRPHP